MFFQNQFYNETAYALIIFLLIVITGRILLVILRKISEKTKITADDRIYKSIKNPTWLIIISFAAYAGIKVVSLLRNYSIAINNIFYFIYTAFCVLNFEIF